MVSWKKLMCVAFVCFYLGFMVCLANAAQKAPEPETAKTKAELKREKKARDAEKIKAKREAAAKAKREAAEKAKAERKEKARLAALDAEAKKQAKAQIAKAKEEKKDKLAALDAKDQEQAKEIQAERKKLKSRFIKDKAALAAESKQDKAEAKKRKATKQEMAKLDTQYKTQLARIEAGYKTDIAKLNEKADNQAEQIALQKKQIKKQYQEKVAKINLKFARRKEELLIQKLKLPEDTTPQLAVKELSITGNVLIPTAELLENMPLVYNASDKPLEKADKGDLYDFRVLRDVILQPGQTRQVSTRTIQGFTQYILSVYQDQDYAGIYVYVPAGALRAGVELKDGILPVEVLEAAVTAVTISPYDPDQKKMEKGFLRTTAVRQWSPIEVGQVANQKELDDFVNLLNLNPDRYVSARVTKGIEPNTLSVNYDIYEANPWHFFIQMDNSGTDERKWSPRSGIINTNLLGFDDTFTAIYQAPWFWESDWDENYSLYGSYDFPICGPRLRLNVYGGYSEYDIPSGGINFMGSGSFVGGKLRYNAFQTNGWFFDVTTSFSHERSRVTSSLAALFPGFFASDVEYQLWGIGLDVHRKDDMSDTSVAVERLQSIGGSKEAHFKAARTNTDDNFTIYTATAAHSQFLKPDKVERISGTFKYIYPTARLVPARMTTFGGMYTVRGYDEFDIVADGGLLASAQYEYDLVKYDEAKQTPEVKQMQRQKGEKPFIRKLAPLAFFDYGRARTRNTVAGEKGDQTLASVGTGALVELGDNFSGGVYYGWPLTGTAGTDKGQGRFNVGMMLRW